MDFSVRLSEECVSEFNLNLFFCYNLMQVEE